MHRDDATHPNRLAPGNQSPNSTHTNAKTAMMATPLYLTTEPHLSSFPSLNPIKSSSSSSSFSFISHLPSNSKRHFRPTSISATSTPIIIIDTDQPTKITAAPSKVLPFRVGHGFDLHRLEPGYPLIIGGINIPHDRGCEAHSDGDVLLHCVVDAILGALGLPDIGQIFPDTDPKWKGAASSVFIKEAVKLMHEAGYELGNLDATLILQRPKRLEKGCGKLWSGRVQVFPGFLLKERRHNLFWWHWSNIVELRWSNFLHRQLKVSPEYQNNQFFFS